MNSRKNNKNQSEIINYKNPIKVDRYQWIDHNRIVKWSEVNEREQNKSKWIIRDRIICSRCSTTRWPFGRKFSDSRVSIPRYTRFTISSSSYRIRRYHSRYGIMLFALKVSQWILTVLFQSQTQFIWNSFLHSYVMYVRGCVKCFSKSID